MIDAHDAPDDGAPTDGGLDDDAIRAVIARLARPHRSGGRVIERAALLAEGADFGRIMAWIAAHEGRPEAPPPRRASRGLHSASSDDGSANDPVPLRFILPADAVR